MSDQKQKLQQNQGRAGFTIIELLVVISVMGILGGILVANYNSQRNLRNLKIAQSQLSTNLRKTQSFILSSRNLGASSVAAKYYAVRFDQNSAQYTIEGIDKNYTTYSAVETIALPQGITVSNLQMTPAGGIAANVTVARAAFGAPNGKLYTYVSSDTCGVSLVTAVQDPACLLTLSDRQLVITLRDQKTQATKTVTVLGVSGTITASP